jgi:protein-arginine kinase activator protein McsA
MDIAALKAVLDYTIMNIEIGILREEKTEIIKSQKYEEAARIRGKETELMDKMPELPSLEKLKELRDFFK